MEFSIEFWAMCAALWTTYEPAILIWFGLMFGMVVLIATAVMLWYILRPILNR